MSNPTPQEIPQSTASPTKKGNNCLALSLGCAGVIVLLTIGGIVFAYFSFKEGVKYVEKNVLEGQSIQDFLKEAENNPIKAAVSLNPGVEWVGENPQDGTYTIRIKETDELYTISIAEANKGRIIFRNTKGEEVSIDPTGQILIKSHDSSSDTSVPTGPERAAEPQENEHQER